MENMSMQEQVIIEDQRKVQVFDSCDVLVVGGGPSGFTAAVSAARNGAKTILIERYGYLGGMATGGYVTLIDCIDDGTGRIVIKGLVEELLERLRSMDGLIEPSGQAVGSNRIEDIMTWRKWSSTGGEDKIVRVSPVVDPEITKCVMNDMALEAGVKLLFHAWFSKTIVEDGTAKGVIFESKSGRGAVLAKVVIDCTGDGDVFASAGETFHEANLPLGLVFRVGNVDTERSDRFLDNLDNSRKVSADIKRIKGVSGGYSFGELPQGFYIRTNVENIVWFNTTAKGSAINIKDLTEVEISIRQAMMRTIEYYRQHVPGFEKAVIIDTAPQTGVRSSRMLDGNYLITRKELLEGKRFNDAVVVAQPPYKQFNPDDPLKEIPYRSFLPKKTKGLLVAGRCISGDFGAIEMLRVIPTVMLMGQACGTAAAISASEGVDVSEVDTNKLRDRLMMQNVSL